MKPLRTLATAFLLAGALTPLAIGAAPAEADAPLYIVTSQELYRLGADRLAERLDTAETRRAGDTRVLASLAPNRLDELTYLAHTEGKRCGGFFAFPTRAEAEAFLREDRSQEAMSTSFASYTIDNQAVVTPWLAQVSESQIRGTITSLSTNFQNRYYRTANGSNAALWLRDSWKALAASRSDITVETVACASCSTQNSVILTIPGAELANEIVVLGAHLDSTLSGTSVGETSIAPGADDDASGIATLTEVLRVALAGGYRPQRTIKLMGYAAEEVGLLGSKAIAGQFKTEGRDVVGVLQLDMTNYHGSTAADVYVLSDYSNASLVQFLKDLFSTYLAPSGLRLATTSCGYGCSDHASWTAAGFPAAMYAESAFGDMNPTIHSSNDTLANSGGTAEHSTAFAKLGLAFLGELGKNAGGTMPPPNMLTNKVPLTNQSGTTGQESYYWLNVPAGAHSLSFKTTGGTGDADLYVRFGTKPTTASYQCKSDGSTSTETCNIATAQAGTYHVLLKAYSAYSGVSLTGSYDTDTLPPPIVGENTADYPIPDNNATGVSSPIAIASTGTATSVGVEVNIVHPYIGDLVVDLVAPSGTVFNLHNRSGGSADNILKTYAVNAGGTARNGTWLLRVKDRASRDTGYINSWKLTINN
ncbi:MAG: M20/M25/M40 family metallo-hydrolase [Gammaproteobacteria bacterium]|nr:M20/M25/M40 family metallo-hydrolase [Gammaproteobacteria bacterium]